MNETLQQLKHHWMQLRPRERVLLSVGGALLGLMLTYMVLWEPFAEKVDRLTVSIQNQKNLIAWMNDSLLEAKRLRAKGASQRIASGQSLLGLIDSTAKGGQLGPSMKRVEPEGSDRVRVWLEQASFDDLVRWLQRLRREYNIEIESVVVDKEAASGRVNARLIFKGTQA